MQDCIDGILHISKHVRQETSPHLTNLEIEDLCLRYLQAETDLRRRKILVLGSGVVGEGMAKRLTDLGLSIRWCYRTHAPEIEETRRSHIELYNFNELRDQLSEVDLIVCATGSSGHVLHHGHAPFFEQSREVLIVDLSVPRNVAPELDGITENVHVTDLDDLKYWHRREYVDMAKIFEISRRIVDEHLGLYQKIVAGINGGDARE
jgi:glutamyl-tRNA reductase